MRAIVNNSKFKLVIIFYFLAFSLPIFAQEYSGVVFNAETNTQIEYVNIGIINKNIGTVSNLNGEFKITIPDLHTVHDSIRFSCIGYYPLTLQVSDYVKSQSKDICLTPKVTLLEEVRVMPALYKNKTLGIFRNNKLITAGFGENLLGYECGVEFKINKQTKIESLNIGIAKCSFDTLFYRVNVYDILGKNKFKNILSQNILFETAFDKNDKKIKIDLRTYNIFVNNDVLITLEHVEDLGTGMVDFGTTFIGTTHYRKTSHGKWESVPVGISMTIDVKVEQ